MYHLLRTCSLATIAGLAFPNAGECQDDSKRYAKDVHVIFWRASSPSAKPVTFYLDGEVTGTGEAGLQRIKTRLEGKRSYLLFANGCGGKCPLDTPEECRAFRELIDAHEVVIGLGDYHSPHKVSLVVTGTVGFTLVRHNGKPIRIDDALRLVKEAGDYGTVVLIDADSLSDRFTAQSFVEKCKTEAGVRVLTVTVD